MQLYSPQYKTTVISVRFNSVLFPFDPLQIMRALSQEGFSLPENVMDRVPFGGRLEVSGTVGRKGSDSVRLDSDKSILSVQASEPSRARGLFVSLEDIIKKEFDTEFGQWSQYFEFLAWGNIRTENNPMEIWYTHLQKLPVLSALSKELGREVNPFSVRLNFRGDEINSPNWFDVHIQPQIEAPTTHYQFEVVYRRSSRDEVLDFAANYSETIVNVIKTLEKPY